jgi:hypothetical protein
VVDSEAIGTVQQLCDGALLPDVQVRTLKNLHRLFPTRTVRHAGRLSRYLRPRTR